MLRTAGTVQCLLHLLQRSRCSGTLTEPPPSVAVYVSHPAQSTSTTHLTHKLLHLLTPPPSLTLLHTHTHTPPITHPTPQALSAMTSEVIWLIVISFFFAKGFEKTGLGERIANIFVAAMGRSTLGLAYGLSIAELLLSPALPSTTARAGERVSLCWLGWLGKRGWAGSGGQW